MKYKSVTPPYESLLEEVFARHIKNYLKKEIILKEQHKVETICGNFRFDFTLEYASKIIAFECDGQNFHDENTAIYDFWRDSVLLAEGHAHIIFRLSGSVLMQKMDDCIFLLSYFLPDIFDEQFINELTTHTDQLVINQITPNSLKNPPHSNDIIKIIYPPENENNDDEPGKTMDWICLKAETLEDEKHKRIYRFVKKNNGRRLNPLIYKYNKKYNSYGT